MGITYKVFQRQNHPWQAPGCTMNSNGKLIFNTAPTTHVLCAPGSVDCVSICNGIRFVDTKAYSVTSGTCPTIWAVRKKDCLKRAVRAFPHLTFDPADFRAGKYTKAPAGCILKIGNKGNKLFYNKNMRSTVACSS